MSALDQILEGLVRRTTDGKLQWRRNVASNEFVTAIDAIAVVVKEVSKAYIDVPARYQLEIINDEGDAVEVLETSDTLDPISDDWREPSAQDRQLAHLYELARRSALNTQATLEKLVKALEA